VSEFRVGHLQSKLPVGNAGGTVKSVGDFELMVGAVDIVEHGTTTIERREGNVAADGVNFIHLSDTGESFNSVGFRNEGMDAVEQEYPYMVDLAESLGKQVVANVGPVTENPIDELIELGRRAYERSVHGILLNLECPNLGGNSFTPMLADKLFERIDEEIYQRFNKPTFIKVPACEEYSQYKRLLQRAGRDSIGAVVVSNSFKVKMPTDGSGEPMLKVSNENVGLSGPAISEIARKHLGWVLAAARSAGRNIDVVSTNGIKDGYELSRRINLGGTKRTGAVLGTCATLFYTTPKERWSEAVDKLVRQYAEVA
jgi:dihydroorotate dehydrogenase